MRNGQLPGITGKQAKTHGDNGIKGDKIHYIEVVAITEQKRQQNKDQGGNKSR